MFFRDDLGDAFGRCFKLFFAYFSGPYIRVSLGCASRYEVDPEMDLGEAICKILM